MLDIQRYYLIILNYIHTFLNIGDNYTDDNDINNHAKKARKLMKEEFQAAEDDAIGPTGSQRAFLKARTNKIDLDTKVGKVEVRINHNNT